MKKKSKINSVDRRLIGRTAENLFLSILSQKGITAAAFDTEGIDCIVFDLKKDFFQKGTSPFYVQIRCRNSVKQSWNSTGIGYSSIKKIRKIAKGLKINSKSVYYVVGFSNSNDIRTIKYFAYPIKDIHLKRKGQFRVYMKKCEEDVKMGICYPL
ncbi:MAG: hypothetical protein ACHQQQ_03825 [Bacteroidota bacterium]